jgi:hypothetical protein
MLGLDVIQLNSQLSRILWRTSHSTTLPSSTSPRVVFPVLRNGLPRISEQEARVLFCGLLNSTEFYYAIEVPTIQTYCQLGKYKLSARTDLAIFVPENNSLKRAANIEFKAKNPIQKDFTKDIEKLIRERLLGNWFHLLDNENRSTLPSVASKLREGFLTNIQHVEHDLDIIFTICVLQTKRAFIQRLKYQHEFQDFTEVIKEFFLDITKWEQVSA